MPHQVTSPPQGRSSFALSLILLLAAAASAQQTQPPTAAASPNATSEVPAVPGISGFLRGFNAGLSFSGLHDAQTGWATIAQPALGYSFNDIFSLDLTIPIYLYRLAPTRATRPPPSALLVNQRGELGDLLISLHAQFLPGNLQYQVTASATAPTGDRLYGLTSGRPTFDLSNRFEHAFPRLTPSLELGIGDSTTLVNQLVTRNFSSLGPLAHAEVGFAFPLPAGASFATAAYEQLPIGDQKIYQTILNRGRPVTVVSGRKVTEDNGFTNSLDIPINPHTTLTGSYARSLRFHDDVVTLGVTYVLRGTPRHRDTSDDKLLRDIQRELQPSSPPK